jgi:hypothetical protein
MKLLQVFGLAFMGVLTGIPTFAQMPMQETCPHPKGWKPINTCLKALRPSPGERYPMAYHTKPKCISFSPLRPRSFRLINDS